METQKSWVGTLNPDIINKVAMGEVEVETQIDGGIRCRLSTMCPPHAAVMITIEAMVNKMSPPELLRYCIVCKTDARTIYERFIKCVEVRKDEYLFVIRSNNNEELRLVFEDLNAAFDGINEILMKQHHFAIDEDDFEAFEQLTYERATTCS
jgi:hypothetical protein